MYLALTRSNVKRIAWDLLQRLNIKFDIGITFNRTDMVAIFPNGSEIECAGGDHTEDFAERYLGAQFDIVAIDEGGSFSPDILETLVRVVFRPALIDRKGSIIIAGTPREVTKGLFYDSTRGALEHWKRWLWNTTDNVYMRENWLQELAELKAENPLIESTDYYKREYLGQWVSDSGNLVYSGYNPEANVIYDWERTPGDLFVTGVDIGYNDATAFVQLRWQKYSKILYIVEAYKCSGMLTHQIAKQLEYYRAEYPGTRLVADPAWKTVIEDIKKRYHIPLCAAKKYRKHDAQNEFNSDLTRGRIKVVHSSCKELIEEWEKLPWHYKKNGERVEHPSMDNHLADACLYGWRVARHYVQEPSEKPGPESRLDVAIKASEKRESKQRKWRSSI